MASFQAFQNPLPPAQETLTENQTGSCGAARMWRVGEAKVTSSYQKVEWNQQVRQIGALLEGIGHCWQDPCHLRPITANCVGCTGCAEAVMTPSRLLSQKSPVGKDCKSPRVGDST